MAADADKRYREADPADDDDEAYDENADEDFQPEPAAAIDSDRDEDISSSASDAEPTDQAPSTKKRSTKRKPTAQPTASELDSGDEATIRERRVKRRKKTKGADQDDDNESGGEGGWIRTRAQRVAETVQRKRGRHVAAADGEALVTIDVDAIWAELSARPIGRDSAAHIGGRGGDGDGEDDEMVPDEDDEKQQEPSNALAALKDDEDHDDADMITITRRIAYAGEETEVRERVPRTSKRAQEYLALHPASSTTTQPTGTASSPLNRPLKRPSQFEPNPGAVIKGVAPEKLRPHPYRAPTRTDAGKPSLRLEKMTTVQKSAVDWQGFVAGTEGLAAELVEYGKSKAGFLAREEFLDRAQGVREQRARDARLKG